jgi:hypothetical protein
MPSRRNTRLTKPRRDSRCLVSRCTTTIHPHFCDRQICLDILFPLSDTPYYLCTFVTMRLNSYCALTLPLYPTAPYYVLTLILHCTPVCEHSFVALPTHLHTSSNCSLHLTILFQFFSPWFPFSLPSLHSTLYLRI